MRPMSRRAATSRGYAVLAAVAMLAVAAAWLAAAAPAFEVDSRLERSRERHAIAERLAEIGVQVCRRGRDVAWTTVPLGEGSTGRYRAQRRRSEAGSECVGSGAIEASGHWPAITVDLQSP